MHNDWQGGASWADQVFAVAVGREGEEQCYCRGVTAGKAGVGGAAE